MNTFTKDKIFFSELSSYFSETSIRKTLVSKYALVLTRKTLNTPNQKHKTMSTLNWKHHCLCSFNMLLHIHLFLPTLTTGFYFKWWQDILLPKPCSSSPNSVILFTGNKVFTVSIRFNFCLFHFLKQFYHLLHLSS